MTNLKKKILITTFGYPGSGKTYFSERLAKEFNLFHLNSDKIRSEMFIKPNYSDEEHKAVLHFINWLVQELLKSGVSIILDANLNRYTQRVSFSKFAKKANSSYVLIHMKTPIEVAEKRLIRRRNIKNIEKKKYYKPIELSVLHTLKDEMEYPNNKEPVLEIDGLKSYPEQLKIFKKWLKDN